MRRRTRPRNVKRTENRTVRDHITASEAGLHTKKEVYLLKVAGSLREGSGQVILCGKTPASPAAGR